MFQTPFLAATNVMVLLSQQLTHNTIPKLPIIFITSGANSILHCCSYSYIYQKLICSDLIPIEFNSDKSHCINKLINAINENRNGRILFIFEYMVRTILKPTKKSLTISLPGYLVGKVIEVIAFEVNPDAPGMAEQDRIKRIKSISEGLNKYRIDLSDFKFDRDEVNDYD